MPAQCPGNARPKTMRNRLVSIVADAFWAQEKSENQNSFSSTRKVPKRPKRFTPCWHKASCGGASRNRVKISSPRKIPKSDFPKFSTFQNFENVKFLFFPKSPMSTPTMFPWPLWPHKRLRNDFPRRGRRSRPTRPEQARSTTYTERRGQRRTQNKQKC